MSEILINNSDIDKLKKAYKIIAIRNKDNVIDSALHRFMLGRQRYDWLDSLIDYSIAFETLLLTVNGNPNMSELSYRFAINGANLLYFSNIEKNRNKGFKIMKGLYSVRSKIVHGEMKIEIIKTIKKMGYKNVADLKNDIEVKFRGIIFWLSSMNLNNRPYKKLGGWENLLWK